MSEPSYSIRELCNEFEVTARALRFYEDKGLLQPTRRGQNRVYSHRDRGRLILVLRGKRLGFSLDEIREMLDLYDSKGGQVHQLRVTQDKFKARIKALEQQRHDIDQAISELKEACENFETALARSEQEEGRITEFVKSAAGYAGPITRMVSNDDHI